MTRDPYCRALRRRSGSVDHRDPRVLVLYRVLGLVPWEEIEAAIVEAEQTPPFRFTDGWRARKAADVVRVLDAMRKAVR